MARSLESEDLEDVKALIEELGNSLSSFGFKKLDRCQTI